MIQTNDKIQLYIFICEVLRRNLKKDQTCPRQKMKMPLNQLILCRHRPGSGLCLCIPIGWTCYLAWSFLFCVLQQSPS